MPGNRIFATNCSKNMLTNEAEAEWFAKQCYYKELNARLGCGKLKNMLTDTSK